jgi:branched-chain amino acid transport system permease protein
MVRIYFRRIYKDFAQHVLDVPSRLLALLCFPLLLAFPLTQTKVYPLLIMTLATTTAIFASSWDLLVGRTGQMSLGHALFFGIGAYTTAFLTKFYELPIVVTIPLGMLTATLAAVLVGFPSLRVKGPYLALVSMAFPLIGTGLVFYFRDVTGGEKGIYGLPRFFPEYGRFEQQAAEYYLALILLLISAIIVYKVANSRTGIVLVSILDDELASKACGINVVKYKLMAFAISALFAGLAGGFYAHIVRVANYDTLSLNLSFLPVILTILGGLGTIYGPIVGSYIYSVVGHFILDEMLGIPSEWHILLFLVVVILFILKWPRGIARFVTDKLEDLSEEREIEQRGPHIWKKYRRKKESASEG